MNQHPYRYFGEIRYGNPKHRLPSGLYPYVRLHGRCPAAPSWTQDTVLQAKAELEAEQAEAARLRSLRFAAPRRGLDKTIHDFHVDPAYAGDQHRADMAYSLYAAGRGLSAAEIAETILRARDLSHKGATGRQVAYANRTAEKAMKAVAPQ